MSALDWTSASTTRNIEMGSIYKLLFSYVDGKNNLVSLRQRKSTPNIRFCLQALNAIVI